MFNHASLLSSMIPKILLLVEQIRSRTTQIDNLWTPIPIFLQPCALKAVKGIRYAFSTANNAFVLVVAKGAFVTDSRKSCRSYVGVAYGTLAVAFVAEAADGDASGFSAHYQISRRLLLKLYYMIRFGLYLRMMARHDVSEGASLKKALSTIVYVVFEFV